MRPALAEEIRRAIRAVDRPGSFCVSGAVPAVLPGLVAEDVGPIALPLTAAQAKELRAQCEQAPYGKGEQTLVDTSVRRVWRLTPEHFALTNPQWQQCIDQMVSAVRKELGLEKQKLESHLYDLLLYEPGSFFLPHKDGEKRDRMVATLVVVLPSTHRGGALIVRHDGQERTIDFDGSAAASFQIQYAAFYADCAHEVRPLEQGYRLCLIYNLTVAEGKKAVSAPRPGEQVDRLKSLLQQWTADSGAAKLVVTLDHQYTADGLTWDTLKGADRAKAEVLAAAAEHAGCKAYLALLTFHESGSAVGGDDDYYGRGSSRHWDDEDEEEFDDDLDEEEAGGEYEMDEVIESSLQLDHIHDRTGETLPFDTLAVDESELLHAKAITRVKPEEEFEGYTGNAGMTLDRWYRHAAIVLWPAQHEFTILCGGYGPRALPLLKQMLAACKQLTGAQAVALREQCRDLARAILAQWPERTYGGYGDDEDKTDVLGLLIPLAEPALIRAYLDVVRRDVSAHADRSLGKLGERFGWATFESELRAIVEATTEPNLQRNVRLVEQVCLARTPDADGWATLCATLGQAIVAALETLDKTKPEGYRGPQPANRAEMVAALVRAFIATEQNGLLDRLVKHVLALPDEYPLSDVHMPALIELQPWLAQRLKAPNAAVSAWLANCREQLRALSAKEPVAPTDYDRTAPVRCGCKLCAELNQFLRDPRAPEHRFAAPQDQRTHLEHAVRAAHCDLDLHTEKRGRPYTLVCTKNTASYQAAVQKYHAYLDDLARVEAIEKDLPRARGVRKA